MVLHHIPCISFGGGVPTAAHIPPGMQTNPHPNPNISSSNFLAFHMLPVCGVSVVVEMPPPDT